jgi:hypothetical protein
MINLLSLQTFVPLFPYFLIFQQMAPANRQKQFEREEFGHGLK